MSDERELLCHSELARRVAKRLGLPIRHVQAVLSEAGDAISAALAEGHCVRLHNLGVVSASVSENTKVTFGGESQDLFCANVRVRASKALKERLKIQAELERAEASGK